MKISKYQQLDPARLACGHDRPSTRRGRTAGCIFGFTLMASAAACGGQLLHDHVPAAVATLQPVERLPAAQHLSLAIGLPLRHPLELTRLIAELGDPASPNFHRYLTPAQFTERFGPSAADYQALADFATANGLTVTLTHPNRLVLDVDGSITDIEQTFHVTMRAYQHPREARRFYAPDAEPSLDLAVPVLHISGLDNYSLPHPNSKLKPQATTPGTTPNAGSAPSGAYGGGDFRAAYVPGTFLTGAGQSVGLLQFDGYYASDVAAYKTQFGLPDVPLINVPIDGGVTTPGTGNSEVCLDIEMVLAMAPGIAAIYVYEAPNPSPWVDLLSRMANDNLAKQLSCSWGGGSTNPSAEAIFQQMASQGQSFFNATGDSRRVHRGDSLSLRQPQHHRGRRHHFDNHRGGWCVCVGEGLELGPAKHHLCGQQRRQQHLLCHSELATIHQHGRQPGLHHQAQRSRRSPNGRQRLCAI